MLYTAVTKFIQPGELSTEAAVTFLSWNTCKKHFSDFSHKCV